MKSEKAIRKSIEKVTKAYRHVLDCGPATVQINALRALMHAWPFSIGLSVRVAPDSSVMTLQKLIISCFQGG